MDLQSQIHGIPVLTLQSRLQYAFQPHHNEFQYDQLEGNHVQWMTIESII